MVVVVVVVKELAVGMSPKQEPALVLRRVAVVRALLLLEVWALKLEQRQPVLGLPVGLGEVLLVPKLGQ